MSIRGSIFAAMYDRQMARTEASGLSARRKALIGGVTGRVLEIGGGTGANLEHYDRTQVSLVVTEPEPAMVKRLDRKARQHPGLATVLRAPAEEIPYPDDSFDVVVSTLVLCGVDDPQRAVGEIRRVLKPGGEFRFLEHVRSDDPKVVRLQNLMNPVNRFVVCCDCNRPTLATITEAGFVITELEHGELPKAPPFVRPLIIGRATAPARHYAVS